ncbi:MAG: alpha-glucosidase, partial [Anaerolineae bacterium]
RAFVLAARGEADVQEARGMFRVQDSLRVRCTTQSLDSLETGAAQNAVTLSGQLTCAGQSVPYTLTFSALDERQVAFDLRLADPSFNRIFLTYASDRQEHFWGFGEQFTYLDLKGRRVPIWVSEQGVGRGEQPITLGADLTNDGAGGAWYTTYAPMPHYLTSRMRSLFLDTSAYSVFDLRADDFVQVQVWDAGLQGRVFYGDSPLDLLETYTAWAGRMSPLPDWLLHGVVVGMQGGTDRVREVYAQLKERHVPVAAFWLQDWVGQRTTSFGKQLWWNWELDEDRYPGWDALQSDLEADGVRLMVYVSPFLADVSEKSNVRRNLFAEARDLGYLVKDASGAPYMLQNTSFSAALVDLSNPQAYAWYRDVLREQLGRAHAAGWMADFGEALPWDA